MWGNFSAEMIKLVKRPANWLLLAVALTLGLLFTYVIPYAGYKGGTGGPTAGRGLAALVPSQLVGNSVAGLPVFLGAIMVILGVLAVGGEYGWETWKTVLTQGPSRLAIYAGKLGALAVAALGVVVALFAAGTVASMVIAAVENQPMTLPSVGDLLVGLGGGWLIAAMWTAFGVLLAVVLRGVALALGLGLVWLLAVQNLLAAARRSSAGLGGTGAEGAARTERGRAGGRAGQRVGHAGRQRRRRRRSGGAGRRGVPGGLPRVGRDRPAPPRHSLTRRRGAAPPASGCAAGVGLWRRRRAMAPASGYGAGVQITRPRHISSLVPSPQTTYRAGWVRSCGSNARRPASWVQVTRSVSPGLTVTGGASGRIDWSSKL